MHGPAWIENPTISLVLIAAAFFMLYLSLSLNRKLGKDKKKDIVIWPTSGRKILDTSRRWLYFTAFIGLAAVGAHLLAEYTFHIYDITPIDRFTHGLSGMAVTAAVLNLYLTRKRKIYYSTSIGASWVFFVVWEIFEAVFAYVNPNGLIQTGLWDAGIDLWIDSLGALSICFICDELTE